MAPIQFGFLMIPFQAIDAIGPMDVLSSCSQSMIRSLESFGVIPAGTSEHGVDIQFHWIAETLEPVLSTGNLQLVPTTTCDACPALDYLLVGGPDPSTYRLPPRFIDFLRSHVAAGKVLFTTCTGGFCVAESGVLDGKNATTNHGAVDMAAKVHPQVKWSKEKQWVVDGQFWTASGAAAGMDMIVHWVVENYGMKIANIGLRALDYEPRNVDGNRVLPQFHGVNGASE